MISHGDTVAQGVLGAGSAMWREIPLVETIVIPCFILELVKWNLRIGARELTLQISLQKVHILSVLRRDINTSCLDQYWITRQVGMPYQWRIKMWLYVGEVRNPKPQNVVTCVSNVRMVQQHGRYYYTSRNPISFRLQSTHLQRGLAMSLPSNGGSLVCLIN